MLDERVQDQGFRVLSDLELLTLLLGREQAEKALGLTLGDLHALFLEEVEKFVDPGAAVKLKAAAELGRRIAALSRKERPQIMTPQDAIQVLQEDMQYLEKEYFKALLLDTQNRIIAIETISIGTIDTSLSHPREAFGPAIRRCAASVVFAHNHPSGSPEPSEADIQMTARLMVAGEILGIEVMDHIIIGHGAYASFRERGILF